MTAADWNLRMPFGELLSVVTVVINLVSHSFFKCSVKKNCRGSSPYMECLVIVKWKRDLLNQESSDVILPLNNVTNVA